MGKPRAKGVIQKCCQLRVGDWFPMKVSRSTIVFRLGQQARIGGGEFRAGCIAAFPLQGLFAISPRLR